MANPATVGVSDNNPATIVTGEAAVSLTLEPNKVYTLYNSGIDSSAAAKVEVIMCAVDDGNPATSEGAKKFLLTTAAPVEVGPGVTTLLITASANAPLVSVVPGLNTFGRR